MASDLKHHKLGWIGAGGRMGYAMAERLAKAGADVAVYNRTRAKVEPLAKSGCTIVDVPQDLAGRDLIFITVAASDDLKEVTLGPKGVLSVAGKQPKMLIDSSTVSEEASAAVRAAAKAKGVEMLAAPVSGNAKVVKAGKLSFVVSGPRAAYDTALPYLNALGRGSSYVGEGERARLVKICHNVFLGTVIQSLVEVTVLAEKGGVSRAAFGVHQSKRDGLGLHALQIAGPRQSQFRTDFYAATLAQGFGSRPRCGRSHRCRDAAHRAHARDRAEPDRSRPCRG